jgi:hypothetical protein
LMDMEGIYIYRSDRIIYYGGWNDIVAKGPRLQLARLRVEVGNTMDNLLHLNVAKSKIKIPADLTQAFVKYIEDLKHLAEREYYNRENKSPTLSENGKSYSLFNKVASNQGMLLELNKEFPLVESILKNLDSENLMNMNLIFRMINTQINKIKKIYSEVEFKGIPKEDGVSEEEVLFKIRSLLDTNVEKKLIKEDILPALGFKYNSLPLSIRDLLREDENG